MSNKIQSSNDKIYDLIERTAKFGEDLIEFLANLPENSINRTLIGQAIRSGTSIGSNYMEADAAESRNDFYHKIALCKKKKRKKPFTGFECWPRLTQAEKMNVENIGKRRKSFV